VSKQGTLLIPMDSFVKDRISTSNIGGYENPIKLAHHAAGKRETHGSSLTRALQFKRSKP